MRVYQRLEDAILEIRRDLYKSPRVKSPRVQHLETEGLMVEATNYSYSVMGTGLPVTSGHLTGLGIKHFDFWAEHAPELAGWLDHELKSRLYSAIYSPANFGHPESHHPTLKDMKEGGHWSYTYKERLTNWYDVIGSHLDAFPQSRRAFWPVFHPIDAIRGEELTRIPCTLGYQWMLRPDPSGLTQNNLLECTLISRSVDFDKYWLSDIWFAYRLTSHLADELDVEVGNISHFITSFHRFIEASEETF